MMFSRSTKGDKSLDERWHRFRERAKHTTSSLDEWSEREIERYDLDDGIGTPTGERNPRTYRVDKPLRDINRSPLKDRQIDVRDRDEA